VAPGDSLCQEFSGHQGPQGKQRGQPRSETGLRKFDPSAERGKFQMGVGIDEAWDNGRGAVIDFSGPRWAGGFHFGVGTGCQNVVVSYQHGAVRQRRGGDRYQPCRPVKSQRVPV